MISLKRLMICICLAVVIHPATLFAATRRGNDDILTPVFDIVNITDTGSEGFEVAAGLLEQGRTVSCGAEIIRVVTGQECVHRFAPWKARDDAIRRADLFLRDIYVLGIHPGQNLKPDLRWNENPLGSTNWEFNLLALDVLSNATHAFRESGERKYLDRGKMLILDFYGDNLDHRALPSHYSWYDHSVAYRTIHMIDFFSEWKKLGEDDEEFVLAFIELLWRQGLYLEKDRYYSDNTNHGIYANIAQLRLALAFPWLKEASHWERTALERMRLQVRENYTPGGIHMEYSPSYHILTTKLLSTFRADCLSDDSIALPDDLESLIAKATRNIVWLFHPEGKLSLIGDSSLGSLSGSIGSLSSEDPALEWLQSSGRSGAAPEEIYRGFMDAQLFVSRSGWGEVRKMGEESYLIADLCPYGKAHQHDDFLSFEFSAAGVRWFTDLGVFNYNSSDAGRKFVISAEAHNIAVPYENSRSMVRKKRNIPTRSQSDEEGSFTTMLDRIEKITEPSARIEALLQVQEKAGGKSGSRILLMLALSYEELGNNSDKAEECLRAIMEMGRGNSHFEIAAQLLEMLDVTPSDLELKDAADIEAHQPTERRHLEREDDPALVMRPSRGPSGTGKANKKEEEAGVRLVSTFRAVRPEHEQSPVVLHWIEDEDFSYLEGAFRYSKLITEARAFLFIQPGILILVDRLTTTGEYSFRQYFHLPPEVEVNPVATGYSLSGPGEAECLFSCISSPEGTASDVIEGQRHPGLQGWYSGTFDNIEPAPVIEYSFTPGGPGSSYVVHIALPMKAKDTERSSFRIVDEGSSGGWNPAGRAPLELNIDCGNESIHLLFSPSSLFTATGNPHEPVAPRIEISRKKNDR